MQKETVLLVLGMLVFVAPLLGIPESWRAGLLFGLGGLVTLIATLIRLDVRRADRSDLEVLHREHDPHTEPPLTSPR